MYSIKIKYSIALKYILYIYFTTYERKKGVTKVIKCVYSMCNEKVVLIT